MAQPRSQQRRRAGERARSAASYERRAGTRAPGKSILIVCEGAETEPIYTVSPWTWSIVMLSDSEASLLLAAEILRLRLRMTMLTMFSRLI